MKKKEKFIIRSKSNINVKYKGKTINILEFANKYKGKYSLKFKGEKGEIIQCKIVRSILSSVSELNDLSCKVHSWEYPKCGARFSSQSGRLEEYSKY